MTTRNLARLLLGFIIAAFFLWLALRNTRVSDLARAFRSADYRWIVASAAAFMVGYSCRIQRWRLMLMRDIPDLKWRACFGPFMASFAANNVLPFRAGDVLRSFAFNAELGTSSGVVVATLLAERLLDLSTVLVLLGIALTFPAIRSAGIAGAGSAAALVAVVAIVGVLMFPRLLSPWLHRLGRVLGGFSPRIGRRFLLETDKMLATLRHLTDGRMFLSLVMWSMLAWAAEGCVFWFAALALPSVTATSASWIALPIGTLATLVPSTPGYVGTFDYFAVHAMMVMGNSRDASTAYALLVHALLWFPPTLIGGACVLIRKAATSSTQESHHT